MKFPTQASEIEEILKRSGFTLEELAERAAINATTLQRLARGYQKASALVMTSIRNAATMPVYGFKQAQTGRLQEQEVVNRLRYIPVVSWAQAGQAMAYEDLPSDMMRRVPADNTDPRSFAVDIKGDSMEPKYSEGDCAVLLPNSRPRNGELVVANVKNDGPLFKVFHLIGEKMRLSSYNQVYPAVDYLEKDFHWIYAVDAVIKKVRRV